MRPTSHREDIVRRSGSRPDAPDSVITRFRRGLSEANLECCCPDVAEQILNRVDAEMGRLRRADGMADARKMRDAIVLVLSLLDELDELAPEEPDRTVFQEIAGLFRDVADFASFGSDAMRRAAGEGHG